MMFFPLHLQLFNKLRLTPKVGQIVDLYWCSAPGSATSGRKKSTHTHTPRLTSDHFSAQVLFKKSYSWEHHPSPEGIANPSRLQPGSVGARGRPNLCLHYTKAIDYFPPPVSPWRFSAIVQAPLWPHIISFAAQMKTAQLYEWSTPGGYNHSPSLLYMSPILTRRFGTTLSEWVRWNRLWC